MLLPQAASEDQGPSALVFVQNWRGWRVRAPATVLLWVNGPHSRPSAPDTALFCTQLPIPRWGMGSAARGQLVVCSLQQPGLGGHSLSLGLDAETFWINRR